MSVVRPPPPPPPPPSDDVVVTGMATVKFLVSLVFVFVALSAHATYQLFAASGKTTLTENEPFP